ncbi:MAG: Uma2 family endonuclease [Byssovorax sp.]
MTTKVPTPLFLPGALPIAPTEAEWERMTPDERERLLVKVLDSLSDPRSLMSEGRPHKKAKTRALDLLGLHFKTMGRVIYLAEEMAVMYPGEEVFSPDVLAVLDVPQPEEDPRMAWVVADEKKGLDLVLEVLHHGDRKKDLVENVERYARLGIPEYFIYDRGQQHVHGYRLADRSARRYQRIVPQVGRYSSMMLGLDMVIQGGSLRFFQGSAELFGSNDLIDRLSGMVEDLGAKAEQAAVEATAKIEQAEAKAAQAIAGLREGVFVVLAARRIACSEEARARLMSCDDPSTLQRWIAKAATAESVEEVFAV